MTFRSRHNRLLVRFASNKKGATAIEFGLVAIPFIGLLCATFDMGLSFLVERNLDAAVQNAARQIRTGDMQAAGTASAATFVSNYVCPASGSLMSTFVDCTKLIVDVRTASAFTGNDMTNDFYKTPKTNTFCLGSPKVITVVRVAYPMPWYLPVVTAGGVASTAGLVNDVPGGGTSWFLLLTSASAVRTEPYPAASWTAYQTAKGC